MAEAHSELIIDRDTERQRILGQLRPIAELSEPDRAMTEVEMIRFLSEHPAEHPQEHSLANIFSDAITNEPDSEIVIVDEDGSIFKALMGPDGIVHITRRNDETSSTIHLDSKIGSFTPVVYAKRQESGVTRRYRRDRQPGTGEPSNADLVVPLLQEAAKTIVSVLERRLTGDGEVPAWIEREGSKRRLGRTLTAEALGSVVTEHTSTPQE